MAGAQTMGRLYKGEVILTDEEVRTARKMSEHEGMSRVEIADHFGVEVSYIGKILEYQIRSRIYIDPPPLNLGKKKKESPMYKEILSTLSASGSISFGMLASSIESKAAISDEIKRLREDGFLTSQVVGGDDGFIYKLTPSGKLRAEMPDIASITPLAIKPAEKKVAPKKVKAKKAKPSKPMVIDPLSFAFGQITKLRTA